MIMCRPMDLHHVGNGPRSTIGDAILSWEGRKRPVKGTTQMGGIGSGGSVEMWKGVSLEHSYLAIDGVFVRHRWISPFDLYESMMWQNQKQTGQEKTDGDTLVVIRMGGEPGGKWIQNPILLVNAKRIERSRGVESRSHLSEREKDMGANGLGRH